MATAAEYLSLYLPCLRDSLTVIAMYNERAPQEQEGIDAALEAVKLGVNFFDVSPYYGNTRAETVLGKALRQLPRDSFVLSTKVGRYGLNDFDFSAERVTASVNESMERLGVDVIDIIQCHDIEFGDLDQVCRETIPALVKLRESGKVRAVGITGYPLEIFPYVHSCAPPGSVDAILSYCNYNLQNDRLDMLLPAMKRNGVGVINASALCMGLLTSYGGPSWHPADAQTKEASRAANELCESRGTDLPTVAINFAHQIDATAVASTLIGIESIDTLKRNIDALEVNVDQSLMSEVKAIFAPVHNRRWPSGPFGVIE